jgi:hypothetical protein
VIFLVEDRKGRRRSFRNHSLPGLQPRPLRVLRLSEELPFPRDWTGGDLHCHSHWSQDPVEFGADPLVLRRAARALGLGFFAVTDHSYDFAWESPDYTVPTDPVQAFARFRQGVPPDLPGEPVVLPGEEVSCGNCRGENVHLLVLDHPEYIPGQGDGGRRWFENRPDLPLGQVLERTLAFGSPAFAAHPLPGMSWAQRKIFRRGDYHPEDMLPGLTGLQFWNGHLGRDFRAGRDFWVSQSLAGRPLRPAAGNDAHGDLNRCTHVRLPLLSLGQNDRHRFGNARTWLRCGDAVPDRSGLRHALKEAPCVLSDGPYLWIDAQGALSARSLPEFGTWAEILVHGRVGDGEVVVHREASASLELHRRLDLPAGVRWLRAEGRTTAGRTALTQMVPLE